MVNLAAYMTTLCYSSCSYDLWHYWKYPLEFLCKWSPPFAYISHSIARSICIRAEFGHQFAIRCLFGHQQEQCKNITHAFIQFIIVMLVYDYISMTGWHHIKWSIRAKLSHMSVKTFQLTNTKGPCIDMGKQFHPTFTWLVTVPCELRLSSLRIPGTPVFIWISNSIPHLLDLWKFQS